MFNVTFLIGIVPAGFAAQFIDGTLGMGYGVFSTSAGGHWAGSGYRQRLGAHRGDRDHPGFRDRTPSARQRQKGAGPSPGHSRRHWRGAVSLFPVLDPRQDDQALGAGLLLSMGCLIVYRFFTWAEWGVAGKRLSRPRMAILGLVAAFLDAVGAVGGAQWLRPVSSWPRTASRTR